MAPGVDVGGDMNLRGNRREFLCGDRTVLYPDCGGGYMNLYMC